MQRSWIAASIALLLTACGGGGGGGNATALVQQQPATPATPAAPVVVARALQGWIGTSATAGATVTAYELTNGVRGRQIASATTDTEGKYKLDAGDYAGAVLLDASGGSYRDPATGQSTPLAGHWRAALDAVPSQAGASSANLTPLTEAILRNAQAQDGSLPPAAVAAARETARVKLGFDPVTLPPRGGLPGCSAACVPHQVYLGVVAQEAAGGAVTASAAIDDMAHWLASSAAEPSAALLQAAHDYGWNGRNETALTNWTAMRNASIYVTDPPIPAAKAPIGIQVVTVGDYRFEFDNQDARTLKYTLDLLIGDLTSNYPQMAARFNPAAPKVIHVHILAPPLPYPYVAWTSGDDISISGTYLSENPNDVDFIMHEGFHSTQSYPQGAPDGYVEGLANYARHDYSYWRPMVDTGFGLPDPGETIAAGYEVTARFFRWVEIRKNVNIADDVNAALLAGTYTPAFWTAKTGETVEQLWSDYLANPAFYP